MQAVVLLAIAFAAAAPAAALAAHDHKASVAKGSGQHLMRSESDGHIVLESSSSQHIINGTEVTSSDALSKYSFFALPTSSEDSDTWLGCGASIISPTWGMTAAHCFGGGHSPCQGPHSLSLWLGDLKLGADFSISGKAGGQHAKVKADVVCHSQFDGKCSHGHDMVLLHLKEALPSWVTPVPLNLNQTGTDAVGEVTTNIGFGLRESSANRQVIDSIAPQSMREAPLTILADTHPGCASVYAGGYGCSDDASIGAAQNKHTQLCAGATDSPERDTCSGDSGSPMLDSHGVQIGVVSYGGGPGERMSGPGRICADPNYMGVYTRVSAFAQFITQHVTDLPQGR